MKRIDPLRLDSQPQRKVDWPSTFWINVSIQATAHLPSPKPKFILTCYQLNVGLGGVGVQMLRYWLMTWYIYIDLARPKRGARIFFPLHVSRAQRLASARTRTQVVQLRAQCTDHWTTGQSCGVGVPAVQLTTHVKSSTLCGRTVVRLYIQIFSAWWVTTILYNYGATLGELGYELPYRMLRNYSFREKSLCSGCLKKLICG